MWGSLRKVSSEIGRELKEEEEKPLSTKDAEPRRHGP